MIAIGAGVMLLAGLVRARQAGAACCASCPTCNEDMTLF